MQLCTVMSCYVMPAILNPLHNHASSGRSYSVLKGIHFPESAVIVNVPLLVASCAVAIKTNVCCLLTLS